MIEVFLTYNNKADFEKFKTAYVDNTCYLTSYNENTKKGKSDAYKLKSEWGAKLSPFALVTKDDKPIKAFYSEAEDVICNLINFINKI